MTNTDDDTQVMKSSGSACRGLQLDQNITEEIEFHQQTVASDDHSPLHLIREKEMEISGRVLAAKREADEIVAEARKSAARLMSGAQDEAAEEAAKRDEQVQADLMSEVARVREEAEREAAALGDVIDTRRPAAVKYVVDSVTRV
jgi:vacuolar-type H+-ATPase subunit H